MVQISDDMRRPLQAEPSPVFHRLRFLSSCSLGGALVAGAVFGHDLSGLDPRTIGAVVGLLSGIAWIATSMARAS